MRACWDAADTTGTMGLPEGAPYDPAGIPLMAAAVESGSRPVRTFVPVESLMPMAHVHGLSPRVDAPGRTAVADAPGRTAVAQAPGRTAVADAARDPYPGLEVMASGGAEIRPRPMPARRIPGYWSLWGDFEP